MSNDVNLNELDPLPIEKLVDGVVLHVVSQDDGTPKDYKLSVDILLDKLFGTNEIDTIKGTDIAFIQTSNGKNNPVKVDTLQKRFLGSTVLEEINGETLVRVEAGGTKGSVKVSQLVSHIDGGTHLDTIDDIENTNIYVEVNNTKATVSLEVLEKVLLGDSDDNDISADDKIHYVKKNGSKRRISFSSLSTAINPHRAIETIGSDVEFFTEDKTGRGRVTMSGLYKYIKNGLGLPTYTPDDDVSKNVTFQYRDGEKYGFMTTDKAKDIILNNTVITSVDETLKFRAVNGIVGYPAVKKDIIDSFNSVYGIDPNNKQNDMNDGDGFIIVTNGDGNDGQVTFENVSYLTIRDKLLNPDNIIEPNGMSDSTKIHLEGGTTTLGSLKNYLGL